MDSNETVDGRSEYEELEAGRAMGFGERVLSVFMAPREAARGLRERPEWVRVLLLVALITAIGAVLVTRENAEFTREMMASATRIDLTEEQLARMSEVGTRAYVQRAVGAFFWTAVQALLYGVVLFLSGRAMGGRARFKSVFSLVCYSSLVGALGTAIMVAVVKLTGAFPVETSLAVLAGDSYLSTGRVFLGSFEVFWIWQLVVLTLGLSTVERFSVGRAAFSSAILFVLRILVLVGITALSRQFLGMA